jgi:hypothetical protein
MVACVGREEERDGSAVNTREQNSNACGQADGCVVKRRAGAGIPTTQSRLVRTEAPPPPFLHTSVATALASSSCRNTGEWHLAWVPQTFVLAGQKKGGSTNLLNSRILKLNSMTIARVGRAWTLSLNTLH